MSQREPQLVQRSVESEFGGGYDDLGGSMNSQNEQEMLRSFVGSLNPRTEAVSALPTFSIVMPSYNQAQFIERSILSVLNQDYPNIELIVMDGGSTDGTVEIIKKYSKYIAHWVSEKDDGQSHALNKGFARATGEVMGWMNSDDLYLPGSISRAAEALRTGPQRSVVFGDWWSIDVDDKLSEVWPAFDFSLGHFIYEGFTHNSQAMFWTKAAHDRFGQFDLNLHLTMDYDLILRLGRNEGVSGFHRLDMALACFRRYEGQKTSGFDRTVQQEHIRIATNLGYPDKFRWIGSSKRLFYRGRRMYWYGKRNGAGYVLKKATGSLRNRLLRSSK